MIDRLQEMFDKQKVLQERFYNIKTPTDNPVKMSDMVKTIVAEIGEILECDQRWKEWRKNPPEVDMVNKRMEVADLWHFVINLTLFSNMDANDVYEEFIKKNKTNHMRQDEGY